MSEIEDYSSDEDNDTEMIRRFKGFCMGHDFDSAKMIYDIYSNIIIHDESIFDELCINDNLVSMKWYHETNPVAFDKITVSMAFSFIACPRGFLEMAKWFLSLYPDLDIYQNEHHAFMKACENNHLETVRWLVSLRPERYSSEIIYHNENEFSIVGTVHINEVILRQTLENEQIQECLICYDTTSQIITICGHQFCEECFVEWMRRTNICPYCRNKLTDQNVFMIDSN